MSEPTKPRPGDRVRVTYEGTWREASCDRYVDVDVGCAYRVLPSATVEVLPPPEPDWADTLGAVVLDRDNWPWRYDGEIWRSIVAAFYPRSYAALNGYRGPLRLVYNG